MAAVGRRGAEHEPRAQYSWGLCDHCPGSRDSASRVPVDCKDTALAARTGAKSEEKSSVIAVKASLYNHVIAPQKISQKSWVIGRAAASGSPTCCEQKNIVGLVAAKRVDPNVLSFDDCGAV